jgi:hypothetical protein
MTDLALESFLEESGYSEDDLLAVNRDDGKILTRNGGLYKLTESGKILHLDGPSPDPTERL